MVPANNALFNSDLWMQALERYAGDTHLSVKLFDAEERVVFGPVHATPLFQLFEQRGYDPGIFAECARRCLAQTDRRPAVMVSEVYGLAVVGTSLVLEGKIVGAAVGGYAFVDFSQLSEIQRLARDAGIKFERLWEVAREQKPVPQHRLILNGELLQVLGDALLRENYRTRQYEQAVLKLEESVSEKAQAHQELLQTASALRKNEERLTRELAATRQLQAASAMLLESGDEQALYQKIVEAAAAIMQSEMASLQMLFPERGNGGELRLLASRGFDPDGAKFWEWVRADSACSCGAALKSRKRVVVSDVEKCDFMAGTEDQIAYLRTGIRAVQSTPLLSRSGELLGMISTHWRAPHTPEESDLLRFDVLARQAADLLERKQREDALRLAAEFDEAVMANMGEGLYTVSSQGLVTSMNPAAEKLFGWTFAEIHGRKMHDLTHHHHIDGRPFPAEECAGLQVLKQGKTLIDQEDVFIRKDGTFFNVIYSSSPLRSGGGEVIGLVVVFRDITERKQAEEALHEAGKRFRFMAESMPHKIFTARPNGDINYFNPQWMEFTGLSFEQIKDWGWTQFIHPDDVEENVRRWRHSIATGEPLYLEHRFRRADGSYHWHFSRALPMRDASGSIVMWIGSNADIQPIKDQEERLRKSEKMAAAGKLAASLAHEINNPLSSVTNALYLLENHKKLDESARLFVNTAATELARVSRIVKQSLSYYRLGSVPREVDLGEIVQESLQIFGDKFTRAGIELKLRVHSGRQVIGFTDELRQVIDNLLLNAMEAMPYGGRLDISLHDSSDWKHHHHGRRKGIRLTIADTGCGIPKEQQWRIFEPFFTTKPEKGTGLGLWVLQGIVSKHEGSLSLRSSDIEGRSGTVVSIFLPSHNVAPVESEVAHSESAA